MLSLPTKPPLPRLCWSTMSPLLKLSCQPIRRGVRVVLLLKVFGYALCCPISPFIDWTADDTRAGPTPSWYWMCDYLCPFRNICLCVEMLIFQAQEMTFNTYLRRFLDIGNGYLSSIFPKHEVNQVSTDCLAHPKPFPVDIFLDSTYIMVTHYATTRYTGKFRKENWYHKARLGINSWCLLGPHIVNSSDCITNVPTWTVYLSDQTQSKTEQATHVELSVMGERKAMYRLCER